MNSRNVSSALAVSLLLVAGCKPQAGETPPPKPAMTEDQKAVYAFGAAAGRQIVDQTRQLKFTAQEIEAFQAGFTDTLNGKPSQVETSQYESKFQEFARARIAAGVAENEKKSAAYLETAAKEAGAVRTDSGLIFRTVSAGQGGSPKANDVVKVHYEGKLVDGTVFDSSRQRGEPAEFALDRVIPCWTEAVQRMKVGEKAVIVCPAAIAYGEGGAGNTIPPNSTLIFDVELLGFKPLPDAPGKKK